MDGDTKAYDEFTMNACRWFGTVRKRKGQRKQRNDSPFSAGSGKSRRRCLFMKGEFGVIWGGSLGHISQVVLAKPAHNPRELARPRSSLPRVCRNNKKEGRIMRSVTTEK